MERLSVHSGRSSANGDSRRDESFASNTEDDCDPSILDNESTRLDHVPQPEEVKKFSRPHPLARFCGANGLLKLVPTLSGGNLPPPIEIHSLKHLFQKDPQFHELKQFPGPLVSVEAATEMSWLHCFLDPLQTGHHCVLCRLLFEEFASNEAIQCTEIYEYSQSLANAGYMLPHLQAYKFLHATRLAEYGFAQEDMLLGRCSAKQSAMTALELCSFRLALNFQRKLASHKRLIMEGCCIHLRSFRNGL
ncbi:hypothetical protein V5799_025353 [Amblyomma americanum]|uniref:Sec16 Sec23-binding domain-containing protein n=1 Tax=Amblyomma americanum TaxID=6943 RepID=A0AAQ4E9T7_AMBAM